MSFITAISISCVSIILFAICLISLLFVFAYLFILVINAVEW